jgi:DNA end-binding protein Ku
VHDRGKTEEESVVAARAIWKGVIKLGKSQVPVKLYSAVKDSSIHFRLLHEKDLAPVQQEMINPSTDEVVPPEQVRKAYPVGRNQLVVLSDEELQKLQPKPSRDIELTRFVKPGEIDHRWYERAYLLGPDKQTEAYFALVAALENAKREGVARWVMRNKNYVGALRVENGYLALIALRHADEVLAADALEPPGGRALDKREIRMAEQLVSALAGRFDPSDFRDEYRDRVMELIEAKARGSKVKLKKFRPRPVPDQSLDRALEASLTRMSKRRAASGR